MQRQSLIPHPDPSAISVAVAPILTYDDCDNWYDQSNVSSMGYYADEVKVIFEKPVIVADLVQSNEDTGSDCETSSFVNHSHLIPPQVPGTEEFSCVPPLAGVPCVSPCCIPPGDNPASEVHFDLSGIYSVSSVSDESFLDGLKLDLPPACSCTPICTSTPMFPAKTYYPAGHEVFPRFLRYNDSVSQSSGGPFMKSRRSPTDNLMSVSQGPPVEDGKIVICCRELFVVLLELCPQFDPLILGRASKIHILHC
jgi:hypothetical protein